ncbi:MAG: VIT and VWA domain-containing protein [Pyrinomonadaceae bacterium]
MRVIVSVFCFLLFSVFSTAVVFAQGVILPRPCPIRRCPPPPRPVPLPNVLPVKSINFETKIKGQVATTRVEQVFRNDTNQTLEGIYFFPIPENAAIEQFAIWENGKKLVGEVRSREEARRIYDEIVRKQRDPGLLEYAGQNLFQASIFPIPGNSDKKLELTYSQVLKAESGTVNFKYPLGTGKNLWMPRPEVLRTSSSAVSNPAQKFGIVAGSVEITANGEIRNIYSPTHKIDINKKGETKTMISFESSNDPNDFQLFYGLGDSDFGMSLMTYREPGKDGYFLMMISPKEDLDEKPVEKDIVFVLDTSGSMAEQGKIDKAKKALLYGIDILGAGDKFNVISFAGEEHLMESEPIAATASGKQMGRKFVEDLKPTGGTNINDALKAALKQFDSSDRPKMLVFLTDGLPTVGVTDIDTILGNARKVQVSQLRLFPFGVGYDVNTRLLDLLASQNKGAADYVDPKEDMEVRVSNFFTKVNSPVLANIELDFGALRTELIYPREVTEIFRGTQMTLVGKYKNANDLEDVAFVLSGRTGKTARKYNFGKLDFPLKNTENDFLPRLWAVRRVGWLVEEIRSHGENKELRDEIVDLGTRFGIVTPYTSYLATDGSFDGRPSRPEPRVSPMSGVMSDSGASAVAESKKSRAMKESVGNTESDIFVQEKDDKGRVIVKTVGAKTFYLEGDVWIDSEFKADAKLKEKTLVFASNEYFELVNKEKALAQFLAIGSKVVVVYGGTVYRITE